MKYPWQQVRCAREGRAILIEQNLVDAEKQQSVCVCVCVCVRVLTCVCVCVWMCVYAGARFRMSMQQLSCSVSSFAPLVSSGSPDFVSSERLGTLVYKRLSGVKLTLGFNTTKRGVAKLGRARLRTTRQVQQPE